MGRMCGFLLVLMFLVCLSCTTSPGGMDMSDRPIVRLAEDSLFGRSQQVGLEYVLRLDPDRLLAPVYEAMGRAGEAKAPRYGGWEGRQIAGHSLGHYLSALASFWEATGDPRVEERIDYILEELARLQRPDGYLGGVESRPFDIAATGTFSVDAFSLAGYWVPWYSIHKIYAGLIDVYRATSDPRALRIVRRMADWAIEKTAGMTDAQFQRMLDCEHGGMCEVMAELYAITGEEKYLKMAERFVHRAVMEPLMKEMDVLQGLHANTQIPKVIGLARLYELTGKEEYRRGAEFFFRNVVDHRSYVIGGNSIREHFGPPDQERLGRDTCETCNTYNMLKLAEHLFHWNKIFYYVDFYERALYNHILASQEPETGAKCYFMSTEPGHFKVYGTEENSFWCCTGTGMENPARYNRFIWVRDGDTLYINLFIPSTYTEGDASLRLITDFPFAQDVQVECLSWDPSITRILIRKPSWAGDSFRVRVGDSSFTQEEGGYVVVDRPLSPGEPLWIEFEMEIHAHVTRDRFRHIAFLYGPVVLAARLGTEEFPEIDVVADHLALMYHPNPVKPAPFCGDLDNPAQYFILKDPSRLEFENLPQAFEDGRSLIFIPYFSLHHERYAIYFDTKGDEVPEREDPYASRTIDVVYPGQQQSEIEHELESKRSFSGYLPSIDMTWRDARGIGGFFSYVMRFKPGVPNVLLVTYYGMDGPVGASKRKFTISVAGKVIAAEELLSRGVDAPVHVDYRVDPEVLQGLPVDEEGYVYARVMFSTVGATSYAGGVLQIRVLEGE